MGWTSRSYQGLGPGGFHRISYTEQGDAAAGRTVVCVHGLSRTGRDFDDLAPALAAAGFRVVAPDVVGRGDSDWLRPGGDYGIPQYCADLVALLARLDIESVDWIGTSMGGLIGIALAAMPGSPIQRLVLNDVGPYVPKASLERIGRYVGHDTRFASIEAAEAWYRETAAGFGRLSDAAWRHMATSGTRPDGQGGLRLHYDPAIGAPLHDVEALADVDLWPLWEAIACPVLLLRGADSDVLPAAVAEEMTRRGPGCELHEFTGVGHVPALIDPAQTNLVRDWLLDR